MKAFFVVIGTVIILSVLWAALRDALDPNLTSQYEASRRLGDRGEGPKMDGSPDNIFWMVQLSDIHISKFRDLKRGPDLEQFCRDYLPVIQPSLVLITGDLTDAKTSDDRTSGQMEEEWQIYRHAIDTCKTFTSATFLDTRGNHDAFDVAEVSGSSNLYRKYSVMGTQHALSYHHQHVTPFGTYSFIAVDACPVPGPRRPFNFFGYLDDVRVHQLEGLSVESGGSNLTVWFGHYPTSFIVQDPPGIRHVMRNGVAYLCGHLHTLGDHVTKMFTRHKTGTLELELGDWKVNRVLRVLAVDHDLLTFVDARLGDWPLVLVTNPKDALFLTPRHQPVDAISQSSHIRVLVFSQSAVVSVEVYIDDSYAGRARQSKGPLYTLPWEPQSLTSGLHSLRVTVKDEAGSEKTVVQPFSVDGTTPTFAFWPRFILMMNIFDLSKITFGLVVFIYVLLMASLRQCSTVRSLHTASDDILSRLWNTWVYRLLLVARTGTIYYTLLGFLLYITFCPWFVGEFMTGHLGVLFVWGTFVKGTFIPGSLTYFYGIFQVLTFNVPLTLILGTTLDLRRQEVVSRHVPSGWRRTTRWRLLLADLPFCLLVVFQTYVALTEFPTNYGTTAMVVSPVRGGSVLVAVILLYFAHATHIKRSCAVNTNGHTDQ
ncbi:hypothetical protein V1264_018058 [Littorina saxatilis]